jgi:hypothetical protein
VERPAPESNLPTLLCSRIVRRIVVDGDPHKPPWTGIEPVWLAPANGRPARAAPPPELCRLQLAPDARPLEARFRWQPTAVRVCHDAERLYVLFQCVDRDVWGSFRGRNEPIYDEEVVEAFLAPGADPRRYLELETSPRGAWFEASVESPTGRRDGMRVDRDWRCTGWERAVRVNGTLDRRDDVDVGWSAEWAIPFASLGAASPRPGARWRANFHRIDREGRGQFSAWSPTLADPPDFHVPDRFGWLEFE